MALATLVQEAFINGVSTRRIERLAQALAIPRFRRSTRGWKTKLNLSGPGPWRRNIHSSGLMPTPTRFGSRTGSSR